MAAGPYGHSVVLSVHRLDDCVQLRHAPGSTGHCGGVRHHGADLPAIHRQDLHRIDDIESVTKDLRTGDVTIRKLCCPQTERGESIFKNDISLALWIHSVGG